MQNNYKVVFIGGLSLGSKILDCFLANSNIEVGLLYELQLDSHEKVTYDLMTNKIENRSVKYKCCKKLDGQDIKNIVAYKPDYIFVVNWRTLFDNKLLTASKLGTIGIHASDLPKYRGFAPINWAIINDEKEIGISVFYLDKEVDSGDIIEKSFIKIDEEDDINSLNIKVENEYLELFKKIISNFDNIKKTKQIGVPTYTCKRKPEDGYIDFSNYTAREIFNLVRALTYPYPMAFLKFKDEYIFVNKVKVKTDKKYVGIIPGRVVLVDNNKETVDILCKDGYIVELKEVFRSKSFIYDIPKFIKPNCIFKFGDTV
ncbi:hypothetical protein CRU96_09315 [Malaciobacter halophilus]|nr:formyltransferase family protein [Malaciobacter halophilus]RYA23168.1 hypothetical protein CRU96_09315 [Malaciobacter halophilus]